MAAPWSDSLSIVAEPGVLACAALAIGLGLIDTAWRRAPKRSASAAGAAMFGAAACALAAALLLAARPSDCTQAPLALVLAFGVTEAAFAGVGLTAACGGRPLTWARQAADQHLGARRALLQAAGLPRFWTGSVLAQTPPTRRARST